MNPNPDKTTDLVVQSFYNNIVCFWTPNRSTKDASRNAFAGLGATYVVYTKTRESRSRFDDDETFNTKLL